MTTNAQTRACIAFAIVAFLCGGLKAEDQERTPVEVVSTPTRISSNILQARNLPVDQYLRLQRLALSRASVRFGPRMRSPRLEAHGLERSVVAILDQQGDYLRTHPARRGVANAKSQPALRPCPVPVITSVNGRSKGVIFTPLQAQNLYRIEGCGFGTESGEIFLGSPSDGTPTIQLQLDHSDAWFDDEIDVHLDLHLKGIPDSPVRLIVRPARGRGVELQDCRFVATRGEPRFLETIEASRVKLHATESSAGPISQLEYLSPPSSSEEMPRSATGMSAVVVRVDPLSFGSGSDFFDLSGLMPGWVVESIQLEFFTVACPGDVTRTLQSRHWNASLEARGFAVGWASNSCSSFIPPMFHFALSSSEYAVKVWVIGPAGTEPLRAHSDGNEKQSQPQIGRRTGSRLSSSDASSRVQVH